MLRAPAAAGARRSGDDRQRQGDERPAARHRHHGPHPEAGADGRGVGRRADGLPVDQHVGPDTGWSDGGWTAKYYSPAGLVTRLRALVASAGSLAGPAPTALGDSVVSRSAFTTSAASTTPEP